IKGPLSFMSSSMKAGLEDDRFEIKLDPFVECYVEDQSKNTEKDDGEVGKVIMQALVMASSSDPPSTGDFDVFVTRVVPLQQFYQNWYQNRTAFHQGWTLTRAAIIQYVISREPCGVDQLRLCLSTSITLDYLLAQDIVMNKIVYPWYRDVKPGEILDHQAKFLKMIEILPGMAALLST
ncbi:hypothetical protein DFH28DRAFT_918969, partial [Melampsora americana]